MAATSVARQGNNFPNRNFIPEVWSLVTNAKFYAKTCLMEVANTDWKDEIKGKGSVVYIRTIPTVAIFDNTVNKPIPYQDATDEKIALNIDQAKGWAVTIDNIDRYQMDIKAMDRLQDDAAEQTKIEIEKEVFGSIYADAGTVNASTALTTAGFVDFIASQAALASELNWPKGDRWMILPPWAYWRGMSSDLKAAFLTGDRRSILRDRMTDIGEVFGFTLYESNHLSNDGTTWQALIGHKSSVTFAAQMNEIESGTRDEYFGKYLRGQSVFGFKVNYPTGLITQPITKA